VTVLEAGLYPDMPEALYHADRDSLSVSGAKKLLPPSTPAVFAYERDNPPPPKDVFDFGSAAHRLVLGVGADIVRVDAPDWRGKDAQARRKEIRADGGLPILAGDLETAEQMAQAVKDHPVAAGLFAEGMAEVSLFWQDGDVWRRGRYDWLTQDTIVDYKTAWCAEPETFARDAAKYGYDMQAAWYLDGAAALNLDAERFLFVVQEKTPPYLISVVELDRASVAAGRAKNARALEVYANCSVFDQWPGYFEGVTTVSLPDWSLRGWL